MSFRAYLLSTGTLLGVFAFVPGIEEMLKVYVISVVLIFSLLLNVFFQLSRIRKHLINKLYLDVLIELFKDPDIRKMIGGKVLMNLIQKAKREATRIR